MVTHQDNELPQGFKMTELGPLPEEWGVVTLGKLCQITTGKKDVNQGNPDGKYPFFTCADQVSRSDTYSFDCEAILVAGNGAVGNTKYYEGKFEVYQRTYVLYDFEQHTPYLFLYLYGNIKGELAKRKSGSTMPYVRKGDLINFHLPLPPLPEQRAIAHVLSTIQKAIEAQDKIIGAARQLKKSLMRHLFTYGPVPLSQADQVPLKETEIGPIPEHWEVVRLGDLTSEGIRNGAFVRRNRFGSGVPFLNVADTYELISMDFRSSERVQATQDELELYEIRPNDLFYVRSSLKREGVGQCCIVENVSEPSIYDCHLMRVRVDTNRVIPKYLAYFSVNSPGKQSLVSSSKTTTMTTINQRALASFVFPLPSYSIQQEIANILTNTDTKIQTDEKRKASLQALFKTMLHLLMTGQVRVKELEGQVV